MNFLVLELNTLRVLAVYTDVTFSSNPLLALASNSLTNVKFQNNISLQNHR